MILILLISSPLLQLLQYASKFANYSPFTFVNKAEKPHYEKEQKGHTLNKSKKVTLTNNIQITKKQFF